VQLDHVVIAVRDLEAAIQRYTLLGFAVTPGGVHPALGTKNALVRFGLPFLELITVADEARARQRGPFGAELLDLLNRDEEGLIGYCLSTAEINRCAQRFHEDGLSVEGPFRMERIRPDGRVVAWSLLLPGLSPWRRPWPFLIQWADADDVRALSPSPAHPNGVSGIARIEVLARDVAGAAALFKRQLGLAPASTPTDETRVNERRYQLGGSVIDVLPTGAGREAAIAPATSREGIRALTMNVVSLDRATDTLDRSKTQWVRASAPATIRIRESDACEAVIELQESADGHA
jgi:catechol 2,3-dioxygenase-like lactoylglutathione lyase family enzyme